MTQQQKIDYWHKYHDKLNSFAPLNGSGKNDKLVARLLKSFLNNAIQGLESGGISIAEFTTQLISEDKFREIYSQLYFETGVSFAEWQLKQFVTQKRENPFAVGFSESYKMLITQLLASPIMADRVKNVTNETKKQIRNVLVDARNRNMDIKQTARLMRSKIPSLVKNRALLISRTETTLAASLGAQFGARQTKLKLNKVWIATRDTRTRDAHRAMLNAKPVPQGERFTVGGRQMLFPGDPAGGAKNVCSCRCAISYVPAEDQQERNESNIFNYLVGGIVLAELLS